jgi:hypothetical protein
MRILTIALLIVICVLLMKKRRENFEPNMELSISLHSNNKQPPKTLEIAPFGSSMYGIGSSLWPNPHGTVKYGTEPYQQYTQADNKMFDMLENIGDKIAAPAPIVSAVPVV